MIRSLFLLLMVSLYLIACNNSVRKAEDETDSLSDTLSRNQEFYYGGDASISNSLLEDDSSFFELIPKAIDTANFAFQLKPKGNYAQIKAEIKAERLRLSRLYLSKKDSLEQQQVLDSARNYLTLALVNELIPHWYGMPWSFSGYSAIPQKGEVGCSYFISNTLLHTGFNVNRYKLAQQGPMNEAKSVDSNYVTYFNEDVFSGNNINKAVVEKIVKENEDGLYFIGLSSHVGYLLVHMGELYYLHSNYGRLAVMLEYAETSQEFIDSQYFIAKITHNDELIKKWLLNEKIKVFN